jgi:hypothetical protein
MPIFHVTMRLESWAPLVESVHGKRNGKMPIFHVTMRLESWAPLVESVCMEKNANLSWRVVPKTPNGAGQPGLRERAGLPPHPLYDSTFSRTVWRLYCGAKGLVLWYYRRGGLPPHPRLQSIVSVCVATSPHAA